MLYKKLLTVIALVSLANAMLAAALASGDSGPECCMPPYKAPSTVPGTCICNFVLINQCDDMPGSECSIHSGYEAAYDGYCRGGEEGDNCVPDAGSTTLTVYSGDWYCSDAILFSECNSASDCECKFDLDSLFYSSDELIVSICNGTSCFN